MIEHLKDKGLGVGFACRVLGLSESAYYARKKRPKSARRLRDEQLMPLIEQVHAASGGTYGVRRITHALRRKGVLVARCTVHRLMRELGLEGVIRGQRRRTTVPEPSAPRPPDLVDRDFTASRPDQLWVADMTYVRTWAGWAYVAFVLDVYSRMIVGWQVANHMRTELPLDALENGSTPPSTTYRPPSTNATGGDNRKPPRSPPETRPPDSTKLGTAQGCESNRAVPGGPGVVVVRVRTRSVQLGCSIV
ncbi:IS3 family transposase [Streptomyces sp. NRRL F-6674]|uniref:IS3 family transposase n=1 Tax=Streptomyces sp. NRRL F-6674 TaxID=1463877 RepID=UPI000AD32440|nr:IS3 family transposase [Streptomyces sp. NRRL F-6674]